MKKAETTNTFQNGLVMDFNPLVTPNGVLTSCLNGTLITYNGNENALQNDMGNGRVETAFLPEGYVPLGTAQLGGIIYIVSYNPNTAKCQIGSFPSPERNFSLREIYEDTQGSPKFQLNKLIDIKDENKNLYEVKATSTKILFNNITLYPGDKFKIFGSPLNPNVLSAYGSKKCDINESPQDLKLHIAISDDQSKLTYLDDSLKWSDGYYIDPSFNSSNLDSFDNIDLDTYRHQLATSYNIVGKMSGTLTVVAELEIIKSFSVSWTATVFEKNEQKFVRLYLLVNWVYDNPLEESRGQINPKWVFVEIDSDPNNIKEYELSSYAPSKEPLYDSQNKEFIQHDKLDTKKLSRHNDGYDYDLLVPLYNDNNKYLEFPQTGIVKLNVSPVMRYRISQGSDGEAIDKEIKALVPHLSKTLTINLANIGTGIMTLDRWRYYNTDNMCTLSWGITTNVDPNESIEGLTFNFYKLNSKNYTKINGDKEASLFNKGDSETKAVAESLFPKNENENENENKPNYTLTIPKKVSYSGVFENEIPLKEGALDPDSCYITEMCIKYTGGDRYFYRILYTNKMWNEKYLDPANVDFSTLHLDLTYDVISNVQQNSNETIKSISVPSFSTEPVETPIINNIQIEYRGNVLMQGDIYITQGNVFNITSADLKADAPILSYDPEVYIYQEQLKAIDTNKVVVNSEVNMFSKITVDELRKGQTFLQVENIKVPVLTTYTKSGSLFPTYCLVPFEIHEPYYMGARVRKAGDGCNFVMQKVAKSGIIAEYDWMAGNQGESNITFDSMSSVMSIINNELKNYDIFPFIFYIYESSNNSSKHDFKWVYINGNDWNVGRSCTCGYLVQCKNGATRFVAFPRTMSSGGISNETDIDKFADKCFNDLQSRFKDYYKLVDNTTSVGKIEGCNLTSLNSYCDFSYTKSFNLNLDLNTIVIKINNDVELTSNNQITNLMLASLNQANESLQLQYKNIVHTENELNRIIYSKDVKYAYQNDEGKFVEATIDNVDTTSVYVQISGTNQFILNSKLPIPTVQTGSASTNEYTKYADGRVQNGVVIYTSLTNLDYKDYLYMNYDDEKIHIKAIKA